jgi:ribulose-5-phosphate 4-epimerase/fuculose-1-phosphate aldolase
MASTASSIDPQTSAAEWQLRCDLAACYRLFVKFGWTDIIFTHLSARVPGEDDQYLINPYGLLFHEITASNLIKVNFDGELISGDFPYNDAGHAIHSAVLKARPDINVALHSHTRAGMAVACMEGGLVPMSQQAGEIYDLVCYHEYGVADEDNPEECRRLGADMADKWLMIMDNHGLLSVGRTVAEAFYYLYTLENACKVQVDVMASGATPKKIGAEPLRQLAEYTRPKADGPSDSSTRCWQALIRQLDLQDPSYNN